MRKALFRVMRVVGMPSCEQMSDKTSEEIRAERLARFHLRMCAECQEYRRQLELTTRALSAMPKPEVSPETVDDLVRRLRDH